MAKQNQNLFINTTFLFLSSWLSIKMLLIISKIVVAGIFNIEWIYKGYTIFPISSENSGVWTYFSVIFFFSVDFILLLIISAICIAFLFFKKINNKQKELYFYWVLISTLLILFSDVISSILSKTNSFYLFNWLHISYSIMILTVMPIFFIGVGILAWLCYQYLIAITTKVVSEKNNQISISTYKLYTSAGIIGILILYLPYLSSFNKFTQAEFLLSIVFVLSTSLVKKIRGREISKFLTGRIKPFFIAVASVLYVLFLLFTQ